VYGHQGVREYWTRQWGLIDPHVEPQGFKIEEDGRIAVSVHRVVRDLKGNILSDEMVQHIYLIQDGLVISMEIKTGDYILIPGSATLAQSLIAASLVDEYRFLVHPLIMGRGKRFFKEGMPTTKMTLLKTEPIGLGVSALYYQPL
jgi:dihydrofolate reductase